MKKAFILLFSALLPLLARGADPVEVDGIYYELIPKAKTAHVVSHPNSGYTGDIVIPETFTYNGVNYTVDVISEKAFQYSGITSVIIPDGVTSIKDYAFYRCGSMSSVKFGENVQKIGEYAFSYCSSLTSVELPNSVNEYGYLCFSGCI